MQGFQESEWVDQIDRARVLWKMTELTRGANRAEQRVMELEQLLRDNAVMLQEEDDTALCRFRAHCRSSASSST
jgi:hypothetical protein